MTARFIYPYVHAAQPGGSVISTRELATGVRLLTHLPGFLRRPLTVDEARRVLEHRRALRDAEFLTLVRGAIYGHPASPYRRLLAHAGCEYGDVENLMRTAGIEGALRALLGHGVTVSVDEYKGRRAVARGSLSFAATPKDFANPLVAGHVPVQSSGSRGPRTTTLMDLSLIRDHGVNTCLALEAWGGDLWVKGIYQMPGGSGVYRLLKLSSFGAPVARWFTPIDSSAREFARYRWSAPGLRWASAMVGRPLPREQVAPLDDPLDVARWMADVVRSGETPWIRTLPSLAVRVCQAACERSVDLAGARFTVSGEPITAAKVEAIRRSRADVTARYGSMESGPIGYGCLNPTVEDDVHVFDDLHGIVQPDHDRALLITSLRPNTAVVMLNLSMGDEGTLGERP